MRDAFIAELLQIAKEDSRVVLVTGDLGFGVLNAFWKELPKQIINAGIMEQSMTSIAAGMALSGKIVYTYSIGNFSTMRCLEQIRLDCAYHGANVKVVSIGAGMAYGAQGATHHSTEDIAIMRAIPHMRVYSPCDVHETRAITRESYRREGPCYLRIGRGREAEIHHRAVALQGDGPLQVREGRDVAVFATGAVIEEAFTAAAALKQKGVELAIYSFPVLNPIDRGMVVDCAGQYRSIVTLEEHNLNGGFSSAIAQILMESDLRVGFKALAIPNEFTTKVGDQKYLREMYHISAQDVVRVAEDCL